MVVHQFQTCQVKLTQDANQKIKTGKYSAKPGIEPELSRPNQNHYNLSATSPLKIELCVSIVNLFFQYDLAIQEFRLMINVIKVNDLCIDFYNT